MTITRRIEPDTVLAMVRTASSEPLVKNGQDAGEVPGSISHPKRIPIFVLKNGTAYSRVHPEHILYVEAQGNYVEVHLTGHRWVLRSSLTVILQALPQGLLVRINRAQAVNILRVEHVGSYEVRLNDRSFALSDRYRPELLGRLKVLMNH